MTKLLVSDNNPQGYTTELILSVIRGDLVKRMSTYAGDVRREARSVFDNNVRILNLLGEAITLAEANTRTLSE